MKRFDLPGYAVIEWANTCSKLRAGEFGGGAVVITKNEARSMSTWGWADLTTQQMERAALLDAGFESA